MKLSRLLPALTLAPQLSNASCTTPSPTPTTQPQDWSVKIVDSTLTRFTPSTTGSWEYFVSLTLMGQYLVYKRTHQPHYLTFIQDWADRWIDGDSGNLTITVDSLDDVQAGNVMLILYQETRQAKYAAAARRLRDSLRTYPRNADGAFWHAEYFAHQIWADGSFMVNPFLARYGLLLGDEDGEGERERAFDEASEQVLAYGSRLQDRENKLLQHAYDESKTAKWADPETGLAPAQWCRAMGWYGLAITDLLDILPSTHLNRPELIARLQSFLSGVKAHQDPVTGRWYEVVDRPDDARNWLETSCSCMFVYTVDLALARGYIEDDEERGYSGLVERGYKGVFDKVEVNADGLTDVYDVVVGTNVGSLASYFDRPRKVNDLHGLGALLLMNEQIAYGGRVIVDGK